jgi:hypothetical protein
MKLPDITIKIIPSITVPYVAVRAEWSSPNGTLRTLQNTVPVAVLDDFLGDIVHEMFDEIKIVEEEHNV